MRRGLLVGLSVLLTGYASAARAEVDSNNVSWPGWKVYSSEHWNLDSGPVPSFPLKVSYGQSLRWQSRYSLGSP
jgi:hypothetical protein